MKKTFRFFIALLCVAPCVSAQGAIVIKKAAPVATQSSSNADTSASLLPTVLGLVSGVMDMNAKQKALSAECVPSSQEMTFVDNTIKEWAKTGVGTKDSVRAILRREPCPAADNGYSIEAQTASGASGLTICYNHFEGAGNVGTVWEGFPKTGKATYCKNGIINCPSNQQETVSDTYDLFNLIDFGPADYIPSEATMAARLLNKVEICSNSKINAKKKALWGEFLVNTAGGLGKKTNTGGIMEQVGAMSGSGGMGAVSSLSSVAAQFMNK